MRYGKSAAQEIDQTIRRKPSQKLKSAAPGAPFGWCADGTPYVGTQYCIKSSNSGLKFASLSTRNGGAQCTLATPLSHTLLHARTAHWPALHAHGPLARRVPPTQTTGRT